MPETLSPFLLLKDPATYRACRWDMRVDHEAREYWVEFFKKHAHTILGLGFQMAVDRGEPTEPVRQRMAACVAAFNDRFDRFNADPQHHEQVTILTLDQWRDELFREHGFVDPFEDLKRRENEGVVAFLPTVCAQHDAMDGDELFQAVVEGVFAGNIFDMGAAGSAQLLLEGKLEFFATRKNCPPGRGWWTASTRSRSGPGPAGPRPCSSSTTPAPTSCWGRSQ